MSLHQTLCVCVMCVSLCVQPLIIEEFGKNVSSQDPATIAKERNPTFETVLAALNSSLESGDVLKAAQVLCWMVLAVGGQV